MAQKSNPPAVVAQTPPGFIQLLNRMALEATQEDDTFPSPMVDGVVKILTAETEEEMWNADDLAQTGGRDLADVEQILLAYAVKWSTNPDIGSAFIDPDTGRRMYLLVRSARIETGDEFVWNTSAPLLVGKILWLADRDKLPANVVIRARDLGGGQQVLRLKPIPKRAIQGEMPF